jgi:hypothetical protein
MTMTKEQSLPLLTLCTKLAAKPFGEFSELVRRCLNILSHDGEDVEARGIRLYAKVMAMPKGDRDAVVEALVEILATECEAVILAAESTPSSSPTP